MIICLRRPVPILRGRRVLRLCPLLLLLLRANYSKLGGTVAAAFLGKEVYAKQLDVPQLQSGQFVRRYIGYSLAGDVATNIGRELVRTTIKPDIEMYASQGAATQDSYYPLS